MLDELEIGAENAEAIVAKAIEAGGYTDPMPKSAKDKIEAAHEMIAFALDSFTNDGIRPDAEGEDDEETESIQDAAASIMEMFELAGIEPVKKKGKYTGDVEFGDPPALNGASSDDDDDDDDDDKGGDEAAFDINDIIDGYEDLSATSRVKAIKALKLDPENNDEDYNTLASIEEWENEQDTPSSRVLDLIEDLMPADEDSDGDEDADDEPEAEADDDGDDDDTGDDEPEEYTRKQLDKLDKEELRKVFESTGAEGEFPKRFTDAGKERVIAAILATQEEDEDTEEGEELEEPWEGYDDSSVRDIKKLINAQVDDEDEPLEVAQVEYVLEYEQANEDRDNVVDFLKELIEQLSGEPEAEDEEPEPAPKAKRGRRGAKDPDEADEVDAAVERDDEREERTSKRSAKQVAKDNGIVVTLTREQILTALDSGEVEIEVA